MGLGADATEIDLHLGDALCEAKLTEKDFTAKNCDVVYRYRDLNETFTVANLPREGSQFRGYQLIRDVLAAKHLQKRLFIFVDERRQDLVTEWEMVKGAIQDEALRKRCRLVTWQRLAEACEEEHRKFLVIKYGL